METSPDYQLEREEERLDAEAPAAPAPELERLMEEAQVNYAQRDEFRSDPPRAVALLEHAMHSPKVGKPAAYALARFRKGEWPSQGSRGGSAKTPLAVQPYKRASLWIHGYGWDESFGEAEVGEELEAIYSRAGARLPDETKRSLLSLWSAESLRRYPPAELTSEEWAALDPDQLALLEP